MAEPYPFEARHVIEFLEACLDFGKWPDEEAPAHPPGAAWPWVEELHACNAWLRRCAVPGMETSPDAEAAFRRKRDEAIRRIDRALERGAPGDGAAGEPGPGELTDRLSRVAFELRAAREAGRNPVTRARMTDLLQEQGAIAARLDALLARLPGRPSAAG